MKKIIALGQWQRKGALKGFQLIQMDNGKEYIYNGSETDARKVNRWQYYEQDQYCHPCPEMTILEAFTHIIRNEPHEGRNRLWIDNKEAADIISQFVMDNAGNGSTYGKFVNSEKSPTTGEWWEVEY